MDSQTGEYLKDLQKTELSFCDNASSFLQSGFWGAFKAKFGWEALAFKCAYKSLNETPPLPLLVLHRRLIAGLSFAYIPWGPELPSAFGSVEDNSKQRWAVLKELAEALKRFLPANTAFIRFDPPWYVLDPGSSLPAFTEPFPFIHAGADIQPPDTVLLDLAPPMEAILDQMKPKWRYNARLALKKGVSIRRAGPDEMDVFYTLLLQTAQRDGIAVHNIEYYRALFEEYKPVANSSLKINLYLAENEGDVLAGIVTLFRGDEAVYLYGSSSDKKRNLMAPYALQVKAMEDAKEAGCKVYDLFGIPPNEDPDHPMSGLFRFKTGFGGVIVHRPGSWDYPCRLFLYSLFRKAETLRKNFRTIKKQSRKQESSSLVQH